MKPSRLLFSLVLIGVSINQLAGQVFKTLHGFNGTEGSYPASSVVLSNDTLYVAPSYGGILNRGTIFSIKADGTGTTNLHSFTGQDGYGPSQLLVLGNSIYGTTSTGVTVWSNGTIFKINSDGSGFTNLHTFTASLSSTNSDGMNPSGALVLSGDTLLGVTASGGVFGSGALFAIKTEGTSFTNLHSFAPNEGRLPNSIIISGDTLYGTTLSGTNQSAGSLFAIKIDGSGFKQLHSFSGPFSADGAIPRGGLVLHSNILFGTTGQGGSNHAGTVFRINTDGTGYVVLHSFTGRDEGGYPASGLVVWNNTLYGTTTIGVDANKGTIFSMDIDGGSFTILYAFTGGTDGLSPYGRLLRAGNRLYGTTYAGSTSNYGTIFSFDILTPLSIAPYGSNLILAWPTHPSGFILQSSADLLNPTWQNVTSPTVVVNEQNIVIEPSAGTPHFYRLAQ